jgi:hypothetical protein
LTTDAATGLYAAGMGYGYEGSIPTKEREVPQDYA